MGRKRVEAAVAVAPDQRDDTPQNSETPESAAGDQPESAADEFEGEEHEVDALKREEAPRAPRFTPRHPSEILRDTDPGEMSPGQRASAARQLGIAPETSLDRAKNEILRRREAASRAILIRLEPAEYRGKKISGQIKKWVAPFSIDEIEDYAREYRGGGKYRIQFFDGNGDFSTSEEFEVEGDPALPGEIEEPETRPKRGAPGAVGEDRAAALERQLQEERFERRLTEQQARTDTMFERLTNAITSVTESVRSKPPEPKADLTGLVAQLAPLALTFLQGQQAAAAAARDAQMAAVQSQADAQQKQTELLLTMQEKAETRMAKVLSELKGKEEPVSALLKNLGDLKKVIGGNDDPIKVIRDTIPAILKTHMEMISKIELHKAGVGSDKEETLAERIVGSMTELAEQVLPQMLTRPTTQPVAPYGTPTTPALPAPQQPAAPTTPRGGGTVVTPEQQAAHELAEKANKAAKAAATPVVGAPPAPPTPLQQALGQLASFGIAPEVFNRALAYLADGKGGDDFAHDCATEEEAYQKQNPGKALFFLPKFLAYVSRTKAETVVSMLTPYLQPFPEVAPLTDAVGQAFLLEFCRYFSEPEDDTGEVAGG